MRPPQAHGWDVTLALARAPYTFVRDTAAALGAPAFAARLMLRPTLFVTGREAAAFFYSDVMERAGAAPGFLTATLFGRGGVQGLDDAAHRHRKAMFLDLAGPPEAERPRGVADAVTAALRALAERRPKRIVLQDEMERLLTRAVCDWAAVPLAEAELADRARLLSRLFEHAAPKGPGHVLARRARRRADAWIAGLVAEVRRGRLRPPEGSALAAVSAWRDLEGHRLPEHTAAVELLNLLRPTVAISAYATFVAHAVLTRPEAAWAARASDEAAARFVEEVRRTAPFFPMLIARTRRATAFAGLDWPGGRHAVLDLYGTNRDPDVWARPDDFDPGRHAPRSADPFCPVPQGGGAHDTGHRCPGEWFTVAIMRRVLRWLLHEVRFEVPAQDLALDMRALPALSRSRVVLERLRPA